MAITWLSASDMQGFAGPAGEAVRGGGRWCHVLTADLRAPELLPMLRPAPDKGDYLDEARPGASDRSYFLARRAALRSFVAMHFGIEGEAVRIRYDEPGAPRVIEPGNCFVSVSGRGPLAVLCVASHPAGVDFEPVEDKVPVVEDVLHPSERMAVRAREGAARIEYFLQIWTAKEAYLKALGSGLTHDPAKVAVAFDEERIASITDDGREIGGFDGRLRASIEGGIYMIAACIML